MPLKKLEKAEVVCSSQRSQNSHTLHFVLSHDKFPNLKKGDNLDPRLHVHCIRESCWQQPDHNTMEYYYEELREN